MISNLVTYKELTMEHNNLEEIVDLVGNLLDELEHDWVREDVKKTMVTCLAANTIRIFGAFDDNKLIGTIAFYIFPEVWNYSIISVSEAFWYVLPSYRGRIGIKLVDFVEKKIGAGKISFGLSDPRLVHLMLKKGYVVKKTIVEQK